MRFASASVSIALAVVLGAGGDRFSFNPPLASATGVRGGGRVGRRGLGSTEFRFDGLSDMDEGILDSTMGGMLVDLSDEDMDELFVGAVDPTVSIESLAELDEHFVESGDVGEDFAAYQEQLYELLDRLEREEDQAEIDLFDKPEDVDGGGEVLMGDPDGSRRLMMNSFPELSCNADIDLADCSALTLSSLVAEAEATGDPTADVVVPCGACATVDATDGACVDLKKRGLNVIGKLYFPPTASLTLTTTHVYVQGVLKIDPPSQGNAIFVRLTGIDDKFVVPHGENAALCGEGGCKVGKKPIAIVGGKLEVDAIEDPECPSWVTLKDILANPEGDFDTIEVGIDAASCWLAGDQILLTSPTLDWSHHEVATIKSVDALNGRLALVSPINGFPRAASEAVDADFAVEVANLDRKVVFEAEQDDLTNDGTHGGHLIFYHTPATQLLRGVKLINFGQQGNLGRYPIHFHMCGSVEGSLVTKNVIVNSNQRGIVVHGSHNADIVDNVAFNVKGHCFFTEDAIEHGNTFERNLGAQISAPAHVIPGENDNSPSVFWITNADNSWIGNVATGSSSIGIWFDTRSHVRGPSLMGNEHIRPVSTVVRAFRDNVVHSNRHGVRFYSPGWRPASVTVLEKTKVYRNRFEGYFVHGNVNIVLRNGILADHILGANVFRAGQFKMEGVSIVGLSENHEQVLAEIGAGWYCPGTSEQAGIEIHPNRFGAWGVNGTNLDFRRIGTEVGCGSGKAIRMNTRQVFNMYYNTKDTFTGTTFTDPDNTIGVCAADSYGVTNVVIEDADGSLSALGQAGFLVSDNPAMTAFADSGCTPFAENSCLSFCEGSCLHSILLQTSSAMANEGIELVVTDGIKTTAIDWARSRAFNSGTENELMAKSSFGLALPSGNYEVFARDKATGESTWPDYLQLVTNVLGSPPDCNSPVPVVTVLRPEPDAARCPADLITGGTFEEGTFEDWMEESSSLEASSGTLVMTKRATSTGDYMGVGQWIDVSCLTSGAIFEFKADIRLTDSDGSELLCDIGTADGPNLLKCPEAMIYKQYADGSAVTNPLAMVDASGPDSVDRFYKMRGYFAVLDEDASAQRISVKFQGPATAKHVIDNVQLVAIDGLPDLSPGSIVEPWQAGTTNCLPYLEDIPGWDCLETIQSILPADAVQTRDFLVYGSWGHVPPGCSVTGPHDNSAHWNTNPNGKNNGGFTLYCKVPSDTLAPAISPGTWTSLPRFPGVNECPEPYIGTVKEKCLRAVQRLLPNGEDDQDRKNLVSGSWGHVPPGCSYTKSPDNAAHWNTNPAGNNNGDFSLVCHMESDTVAPTVAPTQIPTERPMAYVGPDSYTVVPRGAGVNTCSDDLSLVPVDGPSCLTAVDMIVANLGKEEERGRKYLVYGSWGHVPPGCSFTGGTDFAAHWNKNTAGNNNGGFDLACQLPSNKRAATISPGSYAIVPKFPEVNSCPDPLIPTGPGECLSAVQSALPPGTSQGRNYLVFGSWGHVPPGCSVTGDPDNAAHYNTYTNGNNNGGFSPVCQMPPETPEPEVSSGSYKAFARYPTLNACPDTFAATTEATCLEAVNAVIPDEAFSIENRRTYLVKGFWGHVPPGCSYTGASDHAAHWNTNANGNNNGGFDLVCQKL